MGERKRQKLGAAGGFTLVELMITVGIAGIAAAIAVPNYLKFQIASRQNQAKVALSGMYTAEKNYALEFHSYTMCLADIGYLPAPGPHYYAQGFAPTVVTLCGPQAKNGSPEPCNRFQWAPTPQDCKGPTGWNADSKGAGIGAPSGIPTQNNLGPGTYVAQTWFTARAVGNIGGVASPTATTAFDGWSINTSPYDAWSIDETKKMLNFQPAL